jgi:hypothetical protein
MTAVKIAIQTEKVEMIMNSAIAAAQWKKDLAGLKSFCETWHLNLLFEFAIKHLMKVQFSKNSRSSMDFYPERQFLCSYSLLQYCLHYISAKLQHLHYNLSRLHGFKETYSKMLIILVKNDVSSDLGYSREQILVSYC